MPLVITGRPKAKAEEKKKRENKGSGEKGTAVKEDRGGEKKVHGVEWSRATTIASRIFFTKTLTEGGIVTQKRLRPCLFVHS